MFSTLELREIRVFVTLGQELHYGRAAERMEISPSRVSYEDLADRTVPEVGALPREMMAAHIPPVTPSGRRLRRRSNRNTEEMVMLVALGELVHPTVRSLVDHITYPGVTSVPISDLPRSQTALARLTANHSPKVQAFALAAADALMHTDLAAFQSAERSQRQDRYGSPAPTAG
jgi:DNA-binding transcriptional LysR family regulator